MTRVLTTVFLASMLAGCSSTLGVGSLEECATKFSVPAETRNGAANAYRLCRELFAEKALSPERRRFVLCALPGMTSAKTNFGLTAAIKACRDQAGYHAP